MQLMYFIAPADQVADFISYEDSNYAKHTYLVLHISSVKSSYFQILNQLCQLLSCSFIGDDQIELQ